MAVWVSRLRFIVLLGMVLGVTGCASVPGPRDSRDPWERYNRTMFNINDAVDRGVIRPVGKGYKFITPRFVDTGITNFFSNLDDVRVSANNLMQAKPVSAAEDVMRIFTNSTLGVLGFFDVASSLGLEKHKEDFGQTLGVWGVKSGPYLVLPIFGPSSLRDGPARVVDAYMYPLAYMDDTGPRWGLWTLDLLDRRADLIATEEALEGAVYDKYSSYRDAFLQRREFLVHDGRPPNQGDDLMEELEMLDELDALDEAEPEPAPSEPVLAPQAEGAGAGADAHADTPDTPEAEPTPQP